MKGRKEKWQVLIVEFFFFPFFFKSTEASGSSIATYMRRVNLYVRMPIGNAVCRTFIASATLRAFSGLRRYI